MHVTLPPTLTHNQLLSVDGRFARLKTAKGLIKEDHPTLDDNTVRFFARRQEIPARFESAPSPYASFAPGPDKPQSFTCVCLHVGNEVLIDDVRYRVTLCYGWYGLEPLELVW